MNHALVTLAAAAATPGDAPIVSNPKVWAVALAIVTLGLLYAAVRIQFGKNQTWKSASETGGVQLIAVGLVALAGITALIIASITGLATYLFS